MTELHALEERPAFVRILDCPNEVRAIFARLQNSPLLDGHGLRYSDVAQEQ